MEIEPRKLAVVMAAVTAYMKSEKSGFLATNGSYSRKGLSGWALAGRREMMNMRRAWQLRLMNNSSRIPRRKLNVTRRIKF
ncbi:MAG: hypothetical protein ACYS8W_11440 [Planctomycetota bacterium]